jgi:methylene-fatty-acyl-phospholipid synthase
VEASIFLPAAALLAIERIGYAWIWHRPGAFRDLCRREGFGDPVDVLAGFFCACKVLQACVFVAWCIYFGSRTGWPDNWITPAGWLGAASIVAGQILNASVFLRLGRVGVFYGNRLGHRTEWHDGFPFSLLDHPQYVGAVLTIWGFFLLVRHPHEDWLALPLLETVYYALGALAERMPQTAAAAADES